MTSARSLLLAFAVMPAATSVVLAQADQQALDRMGRDKIELIKTVLEETGFDGSPNGGGQMPDINLLLSVLVSMEEEPAVSGGGASTSWVKAFVEAAMEADLVHGEDGLDAVSLDRAQLDAILARVLGPDYGAPPPVVVPRNFPYIDAGTHAPIPVTVRGTYLGVVNAKTASNTSLDGTASFDIDAAGFSVDIAGQFDFGAQGVVHLTQATTSGPLGFNRNGGSFLGGTITSTDSTILGFYGPGAEEFGGTWGFTVTGGSDPGAVTGTLKTAR